MATLPAAASHGDELDVLMCIYHHVFLPPNFPGVAEPKALNFTELVRTLQASLRAFKSRVPDEDGALIEGGLRTLKYFDSCHGDKEQISQSDLRKQVHELRRSNTPDQAGIIPLHIGPQNAGILIKRVSDDILVEVFELAATGEAVAATKGRLRRDFPDAAVILTRAKIEEHGVRESLYSAIEEMSKSAVPQAQSAFGNSSENRFHDTADPMLVTQLLFTVMCVYGEATEPTRIQKNTREETRWLEKHKTPWRRSPTWFLLKLALQMALGRETEDNKKEFSLYKKAMAYFMSALLKQACRLHASSEALHAMMSKINQRLLKIGSTEAWMSDVHEALTSASDLLAKRWERFDRKDRGTTKPLLITTPAVLPSTRVGFPGLEHCLRQLSTESASTSNPPDPPTNLLNLRADTLPNLDTIQRTGKHQIYAIAHCEVWVMRDLDAWLDSNIAKKECAGWLWDWMREYQNMASSMYSGDPEAVSVTLLTILELWVALDKSATRIHPLLLDYGHDIPIDSFAALILPRRGQMERLAKVEAYLKERETNKTTKESVLYSFGSSDSFSVRFFATSRELQNLKKSIERDATHKKALKVLELSELKKQWYELKDNAKKLRCETVPKTINGQPDKEHKKDCRRCKMNKDAESMRIQVYEWPLSREESRARSTVFELAVPETIMAWRDATLFLLHDALMMELTKRDTKRDTSSKLETPSKRDPRKRIDASRYEGFKDFIQTPVHKGRIFITSDSSPNTAYRRHIQSLNEDEVLVQNGLNWRYVDRDTGEHVARMNPTNSFSAQCTYTIHAGLEPFFGRTLEAPEGREPNFVIAHQAYCPKDISVTELIALCSMNYGNNIIWINLLRELAMPQAIGQAGPSQQSQEADSQSEATSETTIQQETNDLKFESDDDDGPTRRPIRPPVAATEASGIPWRRQIHSIVQDAKFVDAVLKQLRKSLDRIRSNWESRIAVGSFSCLAARLISLAPEETYRAILEFLGECQRVYLEWLEILRAKINAEGSPDVRISFLRKARDVALLGMSSFSLDQEHLLPLTDREESRQTLLTFAIMIQETDFGIPQDDVVMRIMAGRARRVMRQTYRSLNNYITRLGSTSLDMAIRRSWEDFKPAMEGDWRATDRDNSSWITTNHLYPNSEGFTKVHFDLLTGELLVNGVPLSGLPTRYEEHEMYRLLFGQTKIQVLPCNEPGMLFSAKAKVKGQSVYFGALDPATSADTAPLPVRTQSQMGTYDLLPRTAFEGTLPDTFVNDFVHWYNLDDDSVEFRLKAEAWVPSPSGWKLIRAGEARGDWKLCKGDDLYLISPKSGLGNSLKPLFLPLERLEGLIILWDNTRRVLDVEIPRLKLSFSVEHGSDVFMSNQYKGMKIAINQSIGCLIGLKSKLVLRSCSNGDECLVLILEGPVKWSTERLEEHTTHISVSIEANASKVHAYHLNHYLGMLRGSGELQSQLFLAYLHALTSYVLPDPFTRHTGTEEALGILRSESVRSSPTLSSQNIALLELIAKITPPRRLDNKVVEVVKWDSCLRFQAQHGGFYEEVQFLIAEAQKRKFLYEDCSPAPEISHVVDADLLKRDKIRSSTFRVERFGAESFDTSEDKAYESPRGRKQNSDHCKMVYAIAQYVHRGDFSSLPLEFPVPAIGKGSLMKVFQGCKYLSGHKAQKQQGFATPIQYHPDWLKSPEEIMQGLFWALHGTKSSVGEPKRAMWLASMGFVWHDPCNVLNLTLLAITTIPAFATRGVPTKIEEYYLDKGVDPSCDVLKEIVKNARRMVRPPSWKKPKREPGESNAVYDENCDKEYFMQQDDFAEALVQHFLRLDPEAEIKSPVESLGDVSEYIDVPLAVREVKREFKMLADNRAFESYLGKLCTKLRNKKVIKIPLPFYTLGSQPCEHTVNARSVTMRGILERCSPPSMDVTEGDQDLPVLVRSGDVIMDRKLPSVLEALEKDAKSVHQKEYLARLRSNNEALRDYVIQYELAFERDKLREILEPNRSKARDAFSNMMKRLKTVFIAGSDNDEPLFHGDHPSPWQVSMLTGHSPRISARTILQLLHRDRWAELSDEWRKILVIFATSLAHLQKADRSVQAMLGETADLIRELQNQGPHRFDTMASLEVSPQQLLLEIEGNIRVRKDQEEIAELMQSPPGHTNTIMQLNMGEGKSSVIMPLVAMNFCKDSPLVRVIVPKAHYGQMFDILVEKLGGIIGRRIYQLPFSRALEWDTERLEYLKNMLTECSSKGGVLLMQPDHILSLYLMMLDHHRREDMDRDQGDLLTWFECWFSVMTRDVVDESDENFSPKYELVYTVDEQQSIEFSPDRWLAIQSLLGLVARFSDQVKSELPKAIVVDKRGHRFPHVRILDHEAWSRLRALIVSHILDNGFPGFPPGQHKNRDAIACYLAEKDVRFADIDSVVSSPFWLATSKMFYLLRGLLSGGVLQFALGKRWRVNYGLDPSRSSPTMLIVPYRAKDCPAPRSEFSHPDAVIALTCLSYYYGGLDDGNMALAIDRLVMSDQKEAEYRAWVSTAPTLPPQFRSLEGVNWDDADQHREVTEHLRYSKGVIDFFLANIVFPREIREFPRKLAASGWDLGRQKKLPMTGFSGTNDARDVLPHTIKQLDVSSQAHTNALHLEGILQERNDVCLLTTLGIEGVPRADDIIKTIVGMERETRVILDVGAQVLEMTNEEVAKAWLSRVESRDVQATVFFGEHDELIVIDRRGHKNLLKNSPFATQLDACLVFLDEAHTRGTDLRMPSWYRAAITLSANLTKDRLVQACGRMRKLWTGQSVTFVVNEEIETKIGSLTGRSDITTSDVISWAIRETWNDIRQSMPVWAAQGYRRANAQRILDLVGPDFLSMNQHIAGQFLENDARGLRERYEPSPDAHDETRDDSDDPFVQKINDHCRSFDDEQPDFGNYDAIDKQHESQRDREREQQLAPEIEQEESTEAPRPAKPLKHRVDRDLVNFIKTGYISRTSPAVKFAFESFRSPELAMMAPRESNTRALQVTKDFAASIAFAAEHGMSDDYLKPVQWVLVGGPETERKRHMIVISAFEANRLMAYVRESKFVSLHAYAPRQDQASEPIADLKLWVETAKQGIILTPPKLRIELNLFAGQLYFRTYMGYLLFLDFIGHVDPTMSRTIPGAEVQHDGFIKVTDPEEYKGHKHRFQQSPLEAIKKLMTLRRGLGAIDKTHMGKLLEGQVLMKEDIEPSQKRAADEISEESGG